jgi:hypothetical protein
MVEGHTVEFTLADLANAFLEVVCPLNAFCIAGVKEIVTTCLIFAEKWLNGL